MSIVKSAAPHVLDEQVYGQVLRLLDAYAYVIDDGDIDRWPDFFTEDGVYHLTTRENHKAGLPIGIIRCVGRGMMRDRVKAFHTANVFEPHVYNHLVGRPIVTAGTGPGSVAARSNFQIVRTMESGRADLFATGVYLDRIEWEDGQPRFSERLVVLDSRNVDILVVMPL